MYFNSQPHEEADQHERETGSAYCISTHSLTRRLTGTALLNILDYDISTHSLTRRLTFQLMLKKRTGFYFNSQPHEEADRCIPCRCRTSENFNSQPHEEADNTRSSIQIPSNISTHSLTRRLTCSRHQYRLRYGISTHSLTRRLT